MFHVFTEASLRKFLPGVNLEFLDCPSPPSSTRLGKNFEFSPLCRFWNTKKYVGNMKKYEGNMKEYEEVCGKHHDFHHSCFFIFYLFIYFIHVYFIEVVPATVQGPILIFSYSWDQEKFRAFFLNRAENMLPSPPCRNFSSLFSILFKVMKLIQSLNEEGKTRRFFYVPKPIQGGKARNFSKSQRLYRRPEHI